MPKFTVLCRQDAYVDFTAEVEAETPQEAARLARSAPGKHNWLQRSVSGFDAALYVALDEAGQEIGGTECGKCA